MSEERNLRENWTVEREGVSVGGVEEREGEFELKFGETIL